MSKKKLRFIINPIAGTGKKGNIARSIHQLISKEVFDYEIVYTEAAGHGVELAKEAVGLGYYGVVAVGGDGTVNEIARAVSHSETALGIIPCGSGNGLARHLRIPLQTERAIRMLNKGVVYELDYGVCGNIPFFCTCGMGFDAFISEKFSHCSKRGPLTYMEHILKSGLTYKPDLYTITNEDGSIRSEAFLITCANASQYGNDVFIAPKASMQDGQMDIIMMEPFNAIDAPQIVMQLLNKNIENNDHVRKYHAKSVHITRKNEGPFHCDGEPHWGGTELDIAIVPKGFRAIANPRHFEKKSSPFLFSPAEWVEELTELQSNFLRLNKQFGKTLASSLSPSTILKGLIGERNENSSLPPDEGKQSK